MLPLVRDVGFAGGRCSDGIGPNRGQPERLFALFTLDTFWALHVGLWVHQYHPIR